MPTSMLQPNRSPLGACRSISSVNGRAPAGPGTVERSSKRLGSLSTSEAKKSVIGLLQGSGREGGAFLRLYRAAGLQPKGDRLHWQDEMPFAPIGKRASPFAYVEGVI